MHGESASADKEAAEKYCLKFQEFIETEGYRPQQIFNCDETGLFWKRMLNRTYITKDEKSVLGHKPMKD
ncbi:tigger transposable element-derived protein 1-like protein [Trichonephila clavipes]|nr:tigger transposable element-derived protein 1-like protein [Trichonephila clavipes]